MKTSHRRIALLTGASVSALGLALPAQAQVTPGVSETRTGPNVADTIVISLAGDADALGTVTVASPTATATVNSVATGEIEIVAIATGVVPDGDVNLLVENGGDVLVQAIAEATNPAGPATANAVMGTAAIIYGQGAGTVVVELDNTGSLGGLASADAEATAFADANASMNAGPAVLVFGGETAAAVIDNQAGAELFAVVDANAVGATADADANLVFGLYDVAIGDTANATINNAGTVTVGVAADAVGTAGDANATAFLFVGVTERAFADVGAASGDINNTGNIDITLTAVANADGDAGDAAVANVDAIFGIRQRVFGATAATASFSNSVDANVGVTLIANANGATANADADLFVGFRQVVGGTEARAQVVNDGTMDFTVAAFANATVGPAVAVAAIDGVEQRVFGTAVATADYDNNGTLNVVAVADANSPTVAIADASVTFVISQDVLLTGDGVASAEITNTGDINGLALASADGGTFASADATIDGIYQTVVVTGDGNASAALINTGEIDITGIAIAVSDGVALATAVVTTGIHQSAMVMGTGTAAAVIVNDGGIAIEADALALGGTLASANATINMGVQQSATVVGAGDALVSLANNGSLIMIADAGAVADEGPATAQAFVSTGVSQSASAFDGNASAVLTNSGTLGIAADAEATGEATLVAPDPDPMVANPPEAVAVAVVGNAIVQNAVATDDPTTADADATAIAFFENEGTVTVAADADAVVSRDADADPAAEQFGEAIAVAVVGTALQQNVSGLGGADATATIQNDGAFNVFASASAQGINEAVAIAIATGMMQSVSATGGGDAAAVITNGGTLDIRAVAVASAEDAAQAVAVVDGDAQIVVAVGGGDAAAIATNAGTMSVAADAEAISTGMATAIAFVSYGLFQSAIAMAGVDDGGDATAFFGNEGTFSVTADADATGATADAIAIADSGVVQFVSAMANGTQPSGNALATISNDGSLLVNAIAEADATADAFALAVVGGVYQTAVANGGDATANLSNAGSLTVAASAAATGSAALAIGAVNVGIFQVASANGAGVDLGGGDANAVLTNDGSIVLSAFGSALATDGNATAIGTIGGTAGAGIVQMADSESGDALALLTNNGTLLVDANATAVVAATADATVAPAGTANAFAFAGGVAQFATALDGSATAAVINDGSMAVAGTAIAMASGDANASVTVIGIQQSAAAGGVDEDGNDRLGLTTVTNGGSIFVLAQATAVAGGEANPIGTAPDIAVANATAFAMGVFQDPNGGVADFSNAGTFTVAASAVATGETEANANATALGVIQTDVSIALFDNEGSFDVVAIAAATADTGAAFASALGYGAFAVGLDDGLFLEVVNDGDFTVTALAVAPGTATANAVGMSFQAVAVGTVVTGATPVEPFQDARLSGTIVNSGTLTVSAAASGGEDDAGVALSQANATGIFMSSGVNTVEVTNSGTIVVEALTGNGGEANATGVLVVGNGTGIAPNEDDVFTFTNDGGTIIVRESTDGGATWQRGMAIDVAAAPNNSVINLFGDGDISGNIDIQDGDVIFVQNGETSFDGVINPECLPTEGATVLPFDNAALSACGQGTLTINNGGTLFLRDGTDSVFDDAGPSYVFVETFNVGATGTLALEINEITGGTQPNGTYPRVFADVANLDGTLDIRGDLFGGSGLFDDLFINNVIDANVRNGTFDQCLFNGVDLNARVLLDGGCIYDSQANVDIGLTRIAFNEVEGLSDNQLAVATGIENVFSTDLDGNFGNLLGQLFTFEDEQDFFDALDQMSGVEYPNYLHAVRNNTFVINSFISDQLDCAINIRGIEGCRTPEHTGRVWVMGTYNDAELERNVNAIGYEAKNWSATIGADFLIGNFSLGGFIGYRDLDVEFPDAIVGSDIDSNGWQLGATAAYDVGAFYVRGIGSYSNLDADSRRRISIGTITGEARGNPDLNVWSVYGEAGGRFDLGGSWITPFVALDWTSMELDAFRESGGTGADLDFGDQTESQTSGVIGLKWAGNFGGIIPEAKLAYRHDFDEGFGVNTRFGDAPDGSDFRKFEERDEGSILAGLSLAGALGSNLTGRIGYQGRFNDEVKDHAVYGALTFLFGQVAPPPAPVFVAPPPPPPPATQVCPDGSVILATDVCPAPPPPPPPPPPAGERG